MDLINEELDYDSWIESYLEENRIWRGINKMVTEEKVEESKKVDWGEFDDNYTRIEENEPMDLLLSEWRQVTKEFEGKEKEAIRFSVLEENGEKVKKILDAAGKRLPQALKPLIIAADDAGEKSFRCRITRIGTGKSTKYGVKGLEV